MQVRPLESSTPQPAGVILPPIKAHVTRTCRPCRKYGVLCIAIYRRIPDEESGIRNGNVRVRLYSSFRDTGSLKKCGIN